MKTKTKTEYVVQYRKIGNVNWFNSHVQSFSYKPSIEEINEEFFGSAEELVHYSWEDETPGLTQPEDKKYAL